MKKTVIAAILSVFISPTQAELPSMCFDGTYAGGGECEVIIDGQKVDMGIEPGDFFKNEEDVTKELSDIYEGLHDKLTQLISAKQ